MSKSPESYKVPKITLAFFAISSLAIKSEVNIPANAMPAHEIHMSLDAEQLNYSSKPIVPLNSINITILSQNTHEELAHRPSLAEIAAKEVTPKEFEEWSKVIPCEEGTWHGGAPGFDGLGETAKNWIANGGQQYAPKGYEATPDEQIIEAEKIQKDPPDQNGCQKGGW